MTGLWKSIFAKDDAQQKVREDVINSRERVERASSRLEETIRAVLTRNDELTGRNYASPQRPQ